MINLWATASTVAGLAVRALRSAPPQPMRRVNVTWHPERVDVPPLGWSPEALGTRS